MPSAAGGIQERLTRKLGPLPVWAWAAIIVGAALVYSHLHAQKASGATTQDTGQPAMAAGGIDTGAGAGAAGGGAGAGGPMDNLSGDQLAALYSSLGGLGATPDPTIAAVTSTSGLSATDTAQASGGGTSSGPTLSAPFPVAGTSTTSTGGTETSTIVGGVLPGGGVITGASPPISDVFLTPLPQSKIGQTLTAAGVGGHAGSAGFVTPITPPAVSQVFSFTPSSNLLPKAPPVASSTSAVHKSVAV